jgi:hypothetical protein
MGGTVEVWRDVFLMYINFWQNRYQNPHIGMTGRATRQSWHLWDK